MRILLLSLAIIATTLSFGQYFSNIGPYNTPLHTNVNEIDFVISDSGTPYIFYEDGATNKGNVKYWDGSVWQQYGLPDFTLTNIIELKIKVYYNGTSDVVIVAARQGGNFFECYRWDATTWTPLQYYDDFGPQTITLSAGYEFDLEYDKTNGMAIMVVGQNGTQDSYYNLATGATIWTAPVISMPNIGEKLDLEIDEIGGQWLVTSRNGNTTVHFNNSGSFVNWGNLYTNNRESDELVISSWIGGSTNDVSVGGIKNDPGPDEHDIYHATADNAGIQSFDQIVGPTGLWSTEIDMAAQANYSYYFDSKNGGIVKRHNHASGVVDMTYTDLGVAGTKTNLEIELNPNNEFPIVAFKDASGQLWVRELWDGVSITCDEPNPSFCSGEAGNYGDWITLTSNNLDNTEITMDAVSDDPAIISGVLQPGPLYWDLDIPFIPHRSTSFTTTFTVNAYMEDGSLDNDDQYNVTALAKDSLINYLTLTQMCTNHGAVDLNNYFFPSGGSYGATTTNGILDPNSLGAGNHNVYYQQENATGCLNVVNFNIDVFEAPVANVSAGSSGCTDSTGTASVSVISGVSPFAYYWTTGADSTNLSGLPAGSYTVTVTDNNGCLTTGVANVQNSSVNLVANVSDLACSNDNNGSIDLTIAGTGPYNILWSNGYSTEDITGLSEGTYDVTVEDANGCVSSETYAVTAPSSISTSLAVTNASCAGSDGAAVASISGGVVPYVVEFFDDGNNSLGGTLVNVSSGSYSVVVADGNGCESTEFFVINENGGPSVSSNYIANATCSDDGSIDISITTSGSIVSTNWSNGETTEDISNLAPGLYTVTVVDNGGCSAVASFHVNAQLPITPQICLVTVDSATTKNLVVWEKDITTSISHYNIYREGSQAGVYVFVDSVLYTEDSEFIDHVASPMVKSWRYKISAVNNCGIESNLSDYHKTIHATISVGLGGNFNIHWDSYEGVSYSTWSCWRYTDAGGFIEIWNAASNIFSYTDAPPTTQGLDYVIGFPLAQVCSSTTLKAQDYNGTRSNRSAGIFNGSGLSVKEFESTDFNVTLFPNPNNGLFRVHITGVANGNFNYSILDVTGKLIVDGVETNRVFDKDFSQLDKGVYYMVITNNGVVNTQKVVIQ
jgi:hypothetical protein